MRNCFFALNIDDSLARKFLNEISPNPTYNKQLKVTVSALHVKKVKNVPRTGKSNFSSIAPRAIDGITSAVDKSTNFK